MKDYTYIIGEENISIFLDGKNSIISKNCSKGKALLEALKNNASLEEVKKIVHKTFKNYVDSGLTLCDGVKITDTTILIDNEVISDELAELIKRHYNSGVSINHIVNFIRKIRENPSYRIRNQLWNFIKASEDSGGFAIEDDGDILAYKLVRNDFKDIHTGTIDNSPNCIVEMDRRDVDDNPNNTCSSGLHFCAFSYLENYRRCPEEKIILVKINPRDVVSIPTDYNYAKGRCCRYKVIKEINKVLNKPVYYSDIFSNGKYDSLEEFIENTTKKELADFYNMLIIDTNIPRRKKFRNKKCAYLAYKEILE